MNSDLQVYKISRYGVSGLFGWNTVPADAKQVCINPFSPSKFISV